MDRGTVSIHSTIGVCVWSPRRRWEQCSAIRHHTTPAAPTTQAQSQQVAVTGKVLCLPHRSARIWLNVLTFAPLFIILTGTQSGSPLHSITIVIEKRLQPVECIIVCLMV